MAGRRDMRTIGAPHKTQPEDVASAVRMQKTDPLVSVLIVNYNYSSFLPEAVDSVLAQSYGKYEIVICDDGSTDDSPDIIRSFADRFPDRVRYRLKNNGGVASALNAAYELASGEILSLLDADDRFSPHKLKRIVDEFTKDESTGLVINSMIKFDAKGDARGLIPQVGRLDSGWIRDKLLSTGGHWSFAPASGTSLRRECADDIFPIPEQDFRTEADVYILTQAPLRWKVAAIPQPLSYYRLHGGNVTSTLRIDASYARRIISGLERMVHALQESAHANGLPKPSIHDNPTYEEMSLILDYVDGRPVSGLLNRLGRFWRAAYRCRTSDRVRWRLKPFLLTLVVLLPRRTGAKMLNGMYLPNRLRERWAWLHLRRSDG
jgi:glycosyltransferase involved in cell wall biosynthesis